MPSPSDIHIDQALTNLAIMYKVPPYCADRAMPIVPVQKETDKYYVFGREELKALEARRAVGAESAEITWNVTTAPYSAEEYALKFLLPDRIVQNADSAIQPRINTTNKLTQLLLLAKEKRVRAIMQSTSNFTNAGVSAKWDASTGDPESDVDAAKEVVRRSAGIDPNTMIINSPTGRAIRRKLKQAASALSLNEEITFAKLPDTLWELRMVVGGSIENTAAEGATAAIADIWTDDALVCYVEPSPSLQAMSTGYQLVAQNMLTKSWREDKRSGDFIEVSHIQAEELVAGDAGYLITDVLT